MIETKQIYQITLYDGNMSPIFDGTISFFVDDLEEFESKYFSQSKIDESRKKRYFQSKNGIMTTDYYTDDPEYNIVQIKKCDIYAEKSYKESDVTKIIKNFYGFECAYHINEITYFIRYIKVDNKYLKLCRYEIKGICYDEGKDGYWIGKGKDKYRDWTFDDVRHNADPEYLPSYCIFENGERQAIYHPRYSTAHLYGNQIVDINKRDHLYSDYLSDFADITADMFVWKKIKDFENEQKMLNNIRHCKLGSWETQWLLMDFPGESG